jgi:uncharacterized membrane protein
MLASHERELTAARLRNEPAAQIAARELETVRISTALRRADELDNDVAAAIEIATDPLARRPRCDFRSGRECHRGPE